MVTPRRITLAFVLGCVLFCILEPHPVSGSAEGEHEIGHEIIETFFGGGRHLLQDVTQCPHQWNYDNFTVLEENCPYVVTPNYDKKRCCQYGLGGMLCPFLPLVNDLSTNCAKSFFAILQVVAPNYTTNFFQNICTDPNSKSGIECPIHSTPQIIAPSPSFSPSSHSFTFSLVLAVVILEILVLLF